MRQMSVIVLDITVMIGSAEISLPLQLVTQREIEIMTNGFLNCGRRGGDNAGKEREFAR